MTDGLVAGQAKPSVNVARGADDALFGGCRHDGSSWVFEFAPQQGNSLQHAVLKRHVFRLAEKLIGSGKECQGTASAVPQAEKKIPGFSP
jgi:hypothetical protein